ncbi:hypothetical protein GPROT1_00204 [Gammaproteobacteria bacterium]|nr:hypothetical protein GPROT1_00204 [Gammaproteobacteria bacterium]
MGFSKQGYYRKYRDIRVETYDRKRKWDSWAYETVRLLGKSQKNRHYMAQEARYA